MEICKHHFRFEGRNLRFVLGFALALSVWLPGCDNEIEKTITAPRNTKVGPALPFPGPDEPDANAGEASAEKTRPLPPMTDAVIVNYAKKGSDDDIRRDVAAALKWDARSMIVSSASRSGRAGASSPGMSEAWPKSGRPSKTRTSDPLSA